MRRLGLLIAGALLVTACAPTPAPTPTGAPAAPATRSNDALRIGMVGVGSAVYAYVYATQDRGLFAKNGIKVELTDYNSGSAAQEALAAGEADIIHYFPGGVATAVSKGVKEKIVATDQFKPNEWHVVVATKSNIQGPQDLKGKKVGVTAKGSTTDFFALWLMQKAGVTFDIAPVGNAALYPSVVSGQIDAAVLTPPLNLQGFDNGELRSVFAFDKEMDPSLPSVIVASDKAINEQADGVTRYLKSLFEGVRYLKQNADYCTSFVSKHTNQPANIAQRICTNVIAGYSDDGRIQPAWLQNSLDLSKLGGLNDIPPTDQMFTEKFTPVKLD
jgi:ABC-type nitrate/sulfonate/bicarbonate transport system substrate-binding protein